MPINQVFEVGLFKVELFKVELYKVELYKVGSARKAEETHKTPRKIYLRQSRKQKQC